MSVNRGTSMLSLAVIAGSSLITSPVLARNSGYYNDYPVQYDNNRNYDDRTYGNRNNNYDQGYRCNKGKTGLIIGAIAGGLLGNQIVGRRGDKTAGTIIGAGVGALAGRAVDRSGNRRC
jgi:Glycine zipper 2TM domain